MACNTLEDCLILLGSKKPFLNKARIKADNCIVPFTCSGNLAYEKLRDIINYLVEQNIVEKFNEDLLDVIANEE